MRSGMRRSSITSTLNGSPGEKVLNHEPSLVCVVHPSMSCEAVECSVVESGGRMRWLTRVLRLSYVRGVGGGAT